MGEATIVIDDVLSRRITEFDEPRNVGAAVVSGVTGGYSGNHIFRIGLPDETLCLKVVHDLALADHEWAVLAALQTQPIACVPRPLFRCGDSTRALVMTWVSGESLGNTALTPAQVDALATSLAAFGAMETDQFPPASNFERHIADGAEKSWQAAISSERFDREFDDLRAPVSRLLASPDIDDLKTPSHLWTGRGDPNLANALWDENTNEVSFVDFEHSGYNDRVIELADLAEHAQSYKCDEKVWDRLWDRLELGSREKDRLFLARQLYAMHWLALFLTDDFARRINPPERAYQQADRLRRLLNLEQRLV